MTRRMTAIVSQMIAVTGVEARRVVMTQDVTGKCNGFHAQFGLNVGAVKYNTRQSIGIVVDQTLNPGSYK